MVAPCTRALFDGVVPALEAHVQGSMGLPSLVATCSGGCNGWRRRIHDRGGRIHGGVAQIHISSLSLYWIWLQVEQRASWGTFDADAWRHGWIPTPARQIRHRSGGSGSKAADPT